jgi:hypothetical protein
MCHSLITSDMTTGVYFPFTEVYLPDYSKPLCFAVCMFVMVLRKCMSTFPFASYRLIIHDKGSYGVILGAPHE